MRGVTFRIPNEYNRYLWEIFKFIDFSKYTWYIHQHEIFYFNKEEGRICSNFFRSNILSGTEFKEYITKTDYYIYLANIQAYPKNSEKENIITYTDFIKSKCEIVLLCADSTYAHLYSKNKEYIKNVYELCVKNRFENVEYITDENDERTGLNLQQENFYQLLN